MRAAFDARVLDRRELAERGIGRYAQCLLDALAATDHDVVALRNLRRPPLPTRVAELAEHALLGRDARRAGAGVLHSPSIDLATTRPGVPYVITVHDLVPLKQPERYLRTGIKHRLRYAAVKQATRVITPSHAVAGDCEQLLRVAADRIAIIPEAPAPVFRPLADPQPLLARFELPDHFILWVGGLDPPDPRKRVDALAAAARASDGPPLVLAGRVSPEAADLAAPGRVMLTGRVTDDELAALYTAADAVVLASEEEGFGLTAMEALACGAPVAAFAIPAMQEQYGGRPDVALVEPGDARALLVTAGSLAGTRAAPPARTWTDVAAETWDVYAAAARAGIASSS